MHSVQDAIDFLTTHQKYISKDQMNSLAALTGVALNTSNPLSSVPAPTLPTSSDFVTELSEQLEMVKTLRSAIDGDDPRQIKDLVSASTTLFSMITKLNEDILNQQRIRKIENATVEAIKSLPEEAREAFYMVLEERFS